jgi:predicted nicotinamide N-methyase
VGNEMTELTKYDKLVRLQQVDFVPEIQLYLCDTAHQIVYPNRYPCWAYAWVGGKALARYILDNPELVAGKTVVDMASGSGISAIAAKMAGAARVVAVDDYTPSVEIMQLNAEANGVEIEIVQQDVFEYSPDYGDLFIMGDPFYNDDLFPYIEKKFKPVLVGSPLRASTLYYNFYVKNPIHTYNIVSPPGYDDFLEFNTHIWWLSE